MMMEGGTALYGNLYVLASPWIAPTRDLPCSGKQVQTMVMVISEMAIDDRDDDEDGDYKKLSLRQCQQRMINIR